MSINNVCVAAVVRRLSRILTAYHDREMEGIGIKSTQLHVLELLAEHMPCTITVISNLLGADRTTMARTLGILDKTGYIERNMSITSRRSHAYKLTDKGRQALIDGVALWGKSNAKLEKVLGLPTINTLKSESDVAIKRVMNAGFGHKVK